MTTSNGNQELVAEYPNSRAAKQALREEWAEWLTGRITWSAHLITLTFADRKGVAVKPSITLVRKNAKAFRDRYYQKRQCCPQGTAKHLVLVEERGEFEDRLHLHGIVEGCDPCRERCLNWWRASHGFIADSGVVMTEAAVQYVVKYVTKDNAFWIVD